MADKHTCMGIVTIGDRTQVCACVSSKMFNELMEHYRKELLKEIQAFAGDYSHQIDGVDVVAVEPLLAFLTPIERKDNNGLGSS